jgi:membrane-associated protease RseP (regulator of RpoE activity)
MTVRSSVVGLGMVVGLVGGVAEWAAAQQQDVPRPAAVILKAPQTPIVRRLAASDAIQTEWLGLALEPLSDVLADQLGLKTGMVVDFLAADGPAQKAGLRKNDILLEANGTPIKALSDLLQVVAVAAAEKKPVGLAVLRGGKPLEITVTPEPRPAAVTVERGPVSGQAGEGPVVIMDQPRVQVNPGVIMGRGEIKTLGTFSLPGGYEGEIGNAAGRPGEIVVRRKQDGKEERTWKTTPDKLDVLPEEVRSFLREVLAQLAARPPWIMAVPRATLSQAPTGERYVVPQAPPVQAPTIVTRARTGGLSEAETAAAIAELKKSIDELRAEIARLAARGAGKD